MKMIAFLLVSFSLGYIAPLYAVNTYYLHLQGTAPQVTPADIFQKFNDLFLDPLGVSGKITTNSHYMQVSGPENQFVLNLVFEPSGSSQEQTILNYVAARESLIVLGNKVTFKKVLQIQEVATFLIGSYDGTLHDAFVLKYSYPRDFQFQNLLQWNQFSDEFGFAMLGSHNKFKSYVHSFIKTAPETVKQKMNALLKQNDMAAMDSDISLLLEDGQIIPQEFSQSPFLKYRFFRSCYMPQYENGNCF